MNDEQTVYDNCRLATREGIPIDDATARVIASWWHDGRHGYSFTSTGAINGDVRRWAHSLLRGVSDWPGSDDWVAVEALVTYIDRHEDRDPVEGWSELWVR